MASLRQILNALADELVNTFDCNVVKGFPAWGRPAQDPPVVAVLFAGWEPSGPQRIGASALQGISPSTWQIYVFGRNEVELLDLADTLMAWLAKTEISVNGETAAFQVFGVSRYESQVGVQQELYGVYFNLNVTMR
ncbi:MAG TPA: hypothetical protein G4O02_13330 [Caldilineae bacterium]|nr:hypothetical protein [Caldilineae bacterium]